MMLFLGEQFKLTPKQVLLRCLETVAIAAKNEQDKESK
jgi:hypothetical protein